MNNASALRLGVRVACMVDNEAQFQCVKRKWSKINVKCPKEYHSRSAAVEGIMTQESAVSRSMVRGSGIRRRTVQRETNGTENGADPVNLSAGRATSLLRGLWPTWWRLVHRAWITSKLSKERTRVPGVGRLLSRSEHVRRRPPWQGLEDEEVQGSKKGFIGWQVPRQGSDQVHPPWQGTDEKEKMAIQREFARLAPNNS